MVFVKYLPGEPWNCLSDCTFILSQSQGEVHRTPQVRIMSHIKIQ